MPTSGWPATVTLEANTTRRPSTVVVQLVAPAVWPGVSMAFSTTGPTRTSSPSLITRSTFTAGKPSRSGRFSVRPASRSAASGALAIIWYLPTKLISENFLFDSLSALSLMIAFYYAMTGFACAFYYRRELLKSVKNLIFIGVAPVIGGVLLTFLFFKSLADWTDPANSYTGASWLGFAPPAVIGVGFLLLGVVLLFAWRSHQEEPFFKRRREIADPDLLTGKSEPAAALAGDSAE